ncbi:ABC transporter substrate-binding protein [Okeania sp. KiyG1]|uniref:ABC transporter substrate-binding protein n=1 Tax=Okeania sp. KiyG1 TaxID=2720165 RepID=UPI0019205816|nr:extracellular solute-binding protein [Okeania sp. KiyG1]GFZ89798.1 ABC transporter substrate-binding protein [Okeania sp. KiyG1]
MVFVSCSNTKIQSQNNSYAINSDLREQDSLTIWAEQGFGLEEGKAIAQLVREWEQVSGVKTTLQLRPSPLDDQIETAIQTGNPPDVAFIRSGGLGIVPQLAWEGRLADLTDVIESLEYSFSPSALATVNYQNNITGKRSYYALPNGIKTFNLHYWQTYLEPLRLQQKDIPQDWQNFWQFWQEVRERRRELGYEDIPNFCLTLSNATDGQLLILHFLHGNNVQIFDENGNLVLDRPQNRQGTIDALTQISNLYQNGSILPEAIAWRGPDNNFQFLDKQCLLVANNSFSIPALQKLPDNPYNQAAKNRYLNEIVTLPNWPNKLDGKPFQMTLAIRATVIPANASNIKDAKQFMTYFFQPENLKLWIEKHKGRAIPPIPELLNTPFWQDAEDPHISALRAIYLGPTQPLPSVISPAYNEVVKEKIWAEALASIIQDGISPEEAADRAIARIQKITAQY